MLAAVYGVVQVCYRPYLDGQVCAVPYIASNVWGNTGTQMAAELHNGKVCALAIYGKWNKARVVYNFIRTVFGQIYNYLDVFDAILTKLLFSAQSLYSTAHKLNDCHLGSWRRVERVPAQFPRVASASTCPFVSFALAPPFDTFSLAFTPYDALSPSAYRLICRHGPNW